MINIIMSDTKMAPKKVFPNIICIKNDGKQKSINMDLKMALIQNIGLMAIRKVKWIM